MSHRRVNKDVSDKETLKDAEPHFVNPPLARLFGISEGLAGEFLSAQAFHSTEVLVGTGAVEAH